MLHHHWGLLDWKIAVVCSRSAIFSLVETFDAGVLAASVATRGNLPVLRHK